MLLLIALSLYGMARGQTAYSYRYWIDQDDGTAQAGNATSESWSFSLDPQALTEGLHVLHLQVTDAEGRTSTPLTRPFVYVKSQTMRAGYYWFDNDRSAIHRVDAIDGLREIDLTALPEGFHSLHCQVQCNDGVFSTPQTRTFYRRLLSDDVRTLTMLSFIDGQHFRTEKLQSQGGGLSWEADMSSLPVGFHRLTMRALTEGGISTDNRETFFLRTPMTTELAAMKAYFSIDGSSYQPLSLSNASGVYHFDLDLTEVEEGLHHISLMLDNNNGVGTNLSTRFFIKAPLGGNGLTQYQYWVNDREDERVIKKMESPVNPLQVVQLLPLTTQPLRSSLFQFELTDGVPTMYAKNELHVCFYDNYGRRTDVSRDYVDYSVSQIITDMKQIEPGVRETTAWPAENTVKWYQLTAERGDSLAFRTSLAATLQLFSPSGREVYAASAANAMQWGGLHAEEDGTYYLALHDVTATRGNTINVDYERIDRYAVLRQDVAAVGNGGPSTITFQGNGFDELQSVDFVLGEAVISQQEMNVDGKATVSLKFDFGGAALGQYTGVFHFKEKDLTVSKCVKVEQALPDSVSHGVTFAKQFLLSQGNTYYYKVRNYSNQTAYDVPLTLRVVTTDGENLAQVAIDGLEDNAFDELTDNDETVRFGYERRYTLRRTLRPSGTEPLCVKVKTNSTDSIKVYLDGVGGASEPVTAIDPNDIYGYQDEQGDKTIRGTLRDVYYTIEFENDPEFATAPAHDIYVTDELDPTLFDLKTFAPTRVRIGNKEVELNGEQQGSVTISMMPEIYVTAQIDWTFDVQTGIVCWHISSLDNLTMEPTEDAARGVLPVNQDGNGIGQVSFDIALKPSLANGTEIPNRATIVFDENEPIVTPTWVNVIERDFIPGDVNSDGNVNLTDAAWIVRMFVGRKPNGFVDAAADVNGDGTVNLSDARMVVSVFVGK